MPSKVHEVFNARVVQEIEAQLRSIARGAGPSADFSRQIDHDGSERLTFSIPKVGEEGVETFQHEPDAIFEHRDAQYPGVVIEVSFTQKKKDLARLADSYILGSEGNIRVVVGLDIEYKTASKDPSKRATISLWRPKYNVTERAEMELVAEQTVTDLVCLLTNYNITSLTNNPRNFATKPAPLTPPYKPVSASSSATSQPK
jgi:hypothetical protein